MKVYINNYRDHWLSPYTILEKVFFWKDIDYSHPLIEKLSDKLNPFCILLQKILDKIHPKIDYVKIDKWDTYSMDGTLARIIVPMLKQLAATKHGSPFVDNQDVPEYLRLSQEEEDAITDKFHARWEWVLQEMIWGFEQYTIPHEEAQGRFYKDLEYDKNLKKLNGKIDHEALKRYEYRRANAYRLFGKYYQALWD